MLKISQIDRKISKKLLQNPTDDKKHGTCPQNPTAGPQTYWALVNCSLRFLFLLKIRNQEVLPTKIGKRVKSVRTGQQMQVDKTTITLSANYRLPFLLGLETLAIIV